MKPSTVNLSPGSYNLSFLLAELLLIQRGVTENNSNKIKKNKNKRDRMVDEIV